MYSKNLILDTDSYKTSHYLQFPPGMTSSFYYLESRGGPFPTTVFFGLQPLLQKLSRGIHLGDIQEAHDFFKAHGVPFNADGWIKLLIKHEGQLPIRIKAVPEGSVVPTGNALMTVESTDPEFAWLPGYIETYLMRTWYPTSVASLSYHCKQLIKSYMDRTCDDTNAEINFKLHDFGSRGVSSAESAAIGGAAHLVNFMGSDTVLGVAFANEHYKAGMSGFSIPAAEHSSITSWGKDHELEAYENMLTQFAKPGSLVAIVSDSYDMDHAVTELWGKKLKQRVIDSGATVIIRPDSGIPHEVVLNTLRQLDASFGHIVNSKGYKVLNHVRVIQGDGINYQSLRDILDIVELNKYSVTNVAFGMGGALLQQVNRDTFKFAYKCSSVIVDGAERDVCKAPKGESYKKSKAGRLMLVKEGNDYYTTRENEFNQNALEAVFENGEIKKEYTFEEVRGRAK